MLKNYDDDPILSVYLVESWHNVDVLWCWHCLKVLIIGGGDGGVARELDRYSSVKEVVLCEIDDVCVHLCNILVVVIIILLLTAYVSVYSQQKKYWCVWKLF